MKSSLDYIVQNCKQACDIFINLYNYNAFSTYPDIKGKFFNDLRTNTRMVYIASFKSRTLLTEIIQILLPIIKHLLHVLNLLYIPVTLPKFSEESTTSITLNAINDLIDGIIS